MARIIDGRLISAQIRAEIKCQRDAFVEKTGIIPGLAVILVGDDPASAIYVRNKASACEQVGFRSRVIRLGADTTQEQLEEYISSLNSDDTIHGILVQLPLPKHIDESRIIRLIDPRKDVDAFHPENVGKIMTGDYEFLPCTPQGVMELLRRSDIDVCGKRCVVLGRSNIVGKPMAMLLLHANGTVTIAHSKTKELAEVTRQADILVVAVGKPKFIKADMVKAGAVVIDVGMDRDEGGKLCGDVDYDSCFDKVEAITPVPGGVGPMTITMLLKNTLTAAEIYEKELRK